MTLLNGEMGGIINASTDFGSIEEETQEGIWSIRKIPLYTIIKNAVHTFGGEPYHNIIINDLDIEGLELLEYRHEKPLYLYRNKNDQESNKYLNCFLEPDNTDKITFYTSELTPISLTQMIANPSDYFETLTSTLTDRVSVNSVRFV
jgi:hypothetical protein